MRAEKNGAGSVCYAFQLIILGSENIICMHLIPWNLLKISFGSPASARTSKEYVFSSWWVMYDKCRLSQVGYWCHCWLFIYFFCLLLKDTISVHKLISSCISALNSVCQGFRDFQAVSWCIHVYSCFVFLMNCPPFFNYHCEMSLFKPVNIYFPIFVCY